MLYTKKVLEHFKKPHNYGKIRKPDAIGTAGNLICGDVMQLYIKVKKNEKGEEIIKDIKFETLGCVAAIATSSVITNLVKDKSIKEALKIKKEKIIEALGGLPPIKIHCSVLAIDALYEAIYNYLKDTKKEIPKELQLHHQRILKEKKIIEEKYKEWIKAEEKFFKKL